MVLVTPCSNGRPGKGTTLKDTMRTSRTEASATAKNLVDSEAYDHRGGEVHRMTGAIRRRPETYALGRCKCRLIQTVAKTMNESKHLHASIGVEANADSGFAFEVHGAGFSTVDGLWRESDDRRMSTRSDYRGMCGRNLLLRRSNLHGNGAIPASTCTAGDAGVETLDGNHGSRAAIQVCSLWRSIAKVDRCGPWSTAGVGSGHAGHSRRKIDT